MIAWLTNAVQNYLGAAIEAICILLLSCLRSIQELAGTGFIHSDNSASKKLSTVQRLQTQRKHEYEERQSYQQNPKSMNFQLLSSGRTAKRSGQPSGNHRPERSALQPQLVTVPVEAKNNPGGTIQVPGLPTRVEDQASQRIR